MTPRNYLMLCLGLSMLLILLSGCAHKDVPIIVEKPVPVKVPVSSPCVKNKPSEVVALSRKLTRDEWKSLSTDQREKLLGAQSLDRKAFGDKLSAATAGCR